MSLKDLIFVLLIVYASLLTGAYIMETGNNTELKKVGQGITLELSEIK